MQLLTGVVSGSDNWLHWNVCLQCMGMKGEYIVDDSVFAVKSHYPWVMPPSARVNKMIVIARNPLDAIESLLHLVSCSNHGVKVPFSFKDYPIWWDRKVK